MTLYIYILLGIYVYKGLATEYYPKVSFPRGSVRGKYIYTRGGRKVEGFLGIPYAKPPVGDLRFQLIHHLLINILLFLTLFPNHFLRPLWCSLSRRNPISPYLITFQEPIDAERDSMPPQPDDLVIGDLITQTMPHPCTQPGYLAADSEDCLYLNVFTPNSDAVSLLPVYVYIYGGSFLNGSLFDYTPEYLLDEDVLLVTIQYRLGLFGFLSTGDEVVPGNMGYKDVRCGLRWMKDNIWRFGGDSTKVTIGGNSGGAALVHALMIYMSHEGLFRAVVCQSASGLIVNNFVPPKEVKLNVDIIANVSNCPRDSSDFTNCLKTKSAEELVDIYSDLRQSEHNPERVFQFIRDLPLIGLVIEPACVKDRLATGNPWDYNTSLPLLIGVMSKEYLPCFYVTIDGKTPANFTLFDDTFDTGFPITMKYLYSSADGSQVPFTFRDFYLDNQPFARSNLAQSADGFSDALLRYTSFEAALKSESTNTFFYYFGYIGANTLLPVPPADRIGAVHGDDTFFFFPVRSGTNRTIPEADVQLSKSLVKLWTNFISHLDPTPNSMEGFKWPPFQPQQSYIHIKQHDIQIEHKFFLKRMEFWKSQPYPFRDETYSDVPCFSSY